MTAKCNLMKCGSQGKVKAMGPGEKQEDTSRSVCVVIYITLEKESSNHSMEYSRFTAKERDTVISLSTLAQKNYEEPVAGQSLTMEEQTVDGRSELQAPKKYVFPPDLPPFSDPGTSDEEDGCQFAEDLPPSDPPQYSSKAGVCLDKSGACGNEEALAPQFTVKMLDLRRKMSKLAFQKWNSEFMIIVVMPKSAGLCCALENEERTLRLQFDGGYSLAIGTEVGAVGLKPLA
ncbi:hypothetical protein DFH09DRAFT_1095511 [Mycena vulgaris]|nr:hypothetical protein DFH09DRAFT_1095511 [Mycena vulgaris]